LFHLITGYGIARALGRVHYIPNSAFRPHVLKYLDNFKKVFPRLEETYVVPKYRSPAHVVVTTTPQVIYLRLRNHTATHLFLAFEYGQNPRYFDKYLHDIRKFLQFSSSVRRKGDEIIEGLNRYYCTVSLYHKNFRNISSSRLHAPVISPSTATRSQGISSFVLFGDDRKFMHDLARRIELAGRWRKDAVIISNYTESLDLYLSSQLCRSFLITAATSTFGWWLAFFIPNQSAVFYMSDGRGQPGKIPEKELFLYVFPLNFVTPAPTHTYYIIKITNFFSFKILE
ncbi:hypothetical protein OSTOST_13929, partial [Ostertagia ostertagi]